MGKILIIKNGYTIDPKALERVKGWHRVLIVETVGTAVDIIEKSHVDTVMIFTDDPMEPAFHKFIAMLHKMREEEVPLLFVSETSNEGIFQHLQTYAFAYLTPYPIDLADFLKLTKRCMTISDTLHMTEIILKTANGQRRFYVKMITRIRRVRKKYIRVFYRDPENPLLEKWEDFLCELSFEQFIAYYGVWKYIKQSHQSWMVNAMHIKGVNIKNTADMSITLWNDETVPVTMTYVEDFLNKEEWNRAWKSRNLI